MSTMTENLATVSVTVGEQEMTFEAGKLAKQADGSVVVRAGETMVLATAQGKMEAREGADFFPLTVDVEERMYAAGKIPGGFFKREGRPTERAILTARMIDLSVVGTKDALTMIEAGAHEIPEDEILEAFELAHREIAKICEAQEDLRRQAGKPKYLDPELTAELESQYADRIRERAQAEG